MIPGLPTYDCIDNAIRALPSSIVRFVREHSLTLVVEKVKHYDPGVHGYEGAAFTLYMGRQLEGVRDAAIDHWNKDGSAWNRAFRSLDDFMKQKYNDWLLLFVSEVEGVWAKMEKEIRGQAEANVLRTLPSFGLGLDRPKSVEDLLSEDDAATGARFYGPYVRPGAPVLKVPPADSASVWAVLTDGHGRITCEAWLGDWPSHGQARRETTHIYNHGHSVTHCFAPMVTAKFVSYQARDWQGRVILAMPDKGI